VADRDTISFDMADPCFRGVEETIEEVIMYQVDFVEIKVASMSATKDARDEAPRSRGKHQLEVGATDEHFLRCTQWERDHLGGDADGRGCTGFADVAGAALFRNAPERAAPHSGPFGKHRSQRTYECRLSGTASPPHEKARDTWAHRQQSKRLFQALLANDSRKRVRS
jgi:hypothetical protein